MKIIPLELKQALEWIMTAEDGEEDNFVWTVEEIINETNWYWHGKASILNDYTRFEIADILLGGYDISNEDKVRELYFNSLEENSLESAIVCNTIIKTLNTLNIILVGVND